ncbi:60S ribosomal protein L27-3 [Hordeum vulgare]|nr:60S ribosomal protein L27-3 [Hordeum vulgare]
MRGEEKKDGEVPEAGQGGDPAAGQVIRKDSAKKTAKKSRVKVFLKLVNFIDLMPTRYTLDVDLEEVVSGAPDSLTKNKIYSSHDST